MNSNVSRNPSTSKRVLLLRRREVEAMTRLSRSTIYELMARGDFPRPVRIGQRAVAWREDAVSAWIASLRRA
jgi:prophage regulatory protein